MRHWLYAAIGLGMIAQNAAAQLNLPAPPQPTLPGASREQANLPAVMTIITPGGVEVRSGPTLQCHPTSKLKYGDRVIVLRESEDQKDWYAIKPPPGSFSWINGQHIKVLDQRNAVVEAPSNGKAPVLPGSTVVKDEPKRMSAQIATGSLVTLLESAPMDANGQRWYVIAPVPSEERFIPKDAVLPPQTASVTPPNWQKRPDSFSNPPAISNAPVGQLTAGNSAGPVGTPASLPGPASQPQLSSNQPQWSHWGKLRPTRVDKEGQVYVLEDRTGRLLYVTSTPGTSLRGYVDQTVCLYGTISYRGDLRTYHMIASHIATP